MDASAAQAEQRAEAAAQNAQQPAPEARPQPEQPAPKKEVELPKIETHIQLPKIGRNDTVTIAKGSEVQTMKFKKAERLILEEGWRLLKWEK